MSGCMWERREAESRAWKGGEIVGRQDAEKTKQSRYRTVQSLKMQSLETMLGAGLQ